MVSYHAAGRSDDSASPVDNPGNWGPISLWNSENIVKIDDLGNLGEPHKRDTLYTVYTVYRYLQIIKDKKC
jgi:hypothetical protein